MAAKPAGTSVNADDEDCEPSEGRRGASASPACTGATSLTKRAVAAAEGSRSGRFEALFIKAKLTPTVAAAASASPPPISFQLPGLSLVDFCRAGRGPTDMSALALTGRPPSLSICDRPFSQPGELDLAAVDAEGGGAPGASVEASTTRFNSASMSSALTCRFGAPCMARSPSSPISLAPERCPAPARPTTPMVNNSSTNRSYQREWLVLNLLLNMSN